MTIEELKKDIGNCVENNLLESMLFYTQEFRDILPQQEILKEFFLQVSRLCYNLNKELEEDCD